jgi:hypothetical protein
MRVLSSALAFACCININIAVASTAANDAERSCVNHSQIRSTSVIDDYTVAFEMKDRSVWVNTLPSRCPRLGYQESFSIDVRGGTVCSVDTIQVLEYGFGLQPGVRCGLGKFVRSELSVRELKKNAKEARKAARKK